MLTRKNPGRRIAAAAAALAMTCSFALPAFAAPAAEELTPGEIVTRIPDSAVDTDYYSIHLPESGYISLSLDTDGSGSTKAALISDGVTLFTRGDGSETSCIGLESGDYLLRLSPDVFTGDSYSLLVDFTPSDAWESEFNDGPALADPMPAAGVVSGSIMQSGDRDVYTLDLTDSAYISLDFSAEAADAARWQLSVLDLSENIVYTSAKGGADRADRLALDAGRYYIEVAPSVFSSAAYRLAVSPVDEAEIVRLGGSTRIETAIEISRSGWEAGSSGSVVIANAYNFPDALAGETLASTLDAPILLTAGKHALEQSIIDEIRRLGANSVYILGGESVVSANIADELTYIADSVERLSGSDRYGTAIAIARKILSLKGSVSNIYFASAKDFPDALSISPVAALTDGVILYMPATGSIPDAVADFATTCGCSNAYVIGGKSAISATGESSIRSLGFKVERIGGSDRYSTSTLICTRFASSFGGSAISVASGTSFPDALAGGVFASRRGMPVVLTGKSLPSTVRKYVASVDPDTVYVFGGLNAVSDSVAEQIAQA